MKNFITLSLIAFTTIACAHQSSVDQKVEQEVKAEKTAAFGGEIARESRMMIENNPNLNAEQKQKLAGLHARMMSDVTTIREEMGKLKMVFFKTLLDPKSDEKEIRNIKTRILALDQKKTAKMLSALEEAREILGRSGAGDEKLYRALLSPRADYDFN